MNNFLQRLISGSIFLTLFWYLLLIYYQLFSIFIFLILLIILFTEWPRLVSNNKYLIYLTPIYPILPFILIILLNTPEHRILLVNMFLLVFSFDSGAYAIGKLFGKHKIMPSISPGKTWQGAFGGFLAIISAQIVFNYFNNQWQNFFIILSLSYVVSFLSFFGDIFESFLKRKANVKDSGKILPGHGGLMDRFDSIIFTVLFYYIFKDNLVLIFK